MLAEDALTMERRFRIATRRWRHRVGNWGAHLYRARAPLIVALVTLAALALPSQAYELYRRLALDPIGEAGNLSSTLVASLALAGGLWLLALALTTGEGRCRAALAAACGVLPLLGLTYGFHQASIGTPIFAQGQPEGVLTPAIATIFASVSSLATRLETAAWVLLFASFAIGSLLYQTARSTKVGRLTLKQVAWPIYGLGLVLWLVFAINPYNPPSAIGTLAIVLLFMLVAAAILSFLFWLRDHWRIPAFSLFALVALVLSWSNVSDNHEVPIVPRDPGSMAIQPTALALQLWLASRNDRRQFLDRPYPIFIISAQGGGHFAADFAATFLARAQDRCPNFSQHVFAISSVSGGSIGAGVFAGLAKQFAVNGPWQDCRLGRLEVGRFERLSRLILDRDFLAPVVAATLFGDLPQALFPWSMPYRDRAQIFDTALEHAWDQALPDTSNPMRQPYLAFWRPDGVAPAILANTTQVENGMRVVVAPFMSIDSPLQAGTLHQRARYTSYVDGVLVDDGWEGLGPGDDIAFSTALGLSARFPWVMPAARFRTSKTEFRLVDGGYVDNSGDETSFDLIVELKQIQALGGNIAAGQIPDFEIHLITLASDAALVPGSIEGLGELLSPIRTLLSSRPTRADIASHRIRVLLNPKPSLVAGTLGDFSSPSPLVKLNTAIPLPLTWQLSSTSHDVIAGQTGDASACLRAETVALPAVNPGTSSQEADTIFSINGIVASNSCVACSIVYRLSGTVAPIGRACAMAP